MTAPKLIPPLLGYFTMAGGDLPIIYDTFTDANDTAIASHTPDIAPVGSAWADLTGNIEVYNNRFQTTSTTDSSAIINSGISDYTITMDGTVYALASTYARLLRVIFRHNLTNGTNWTLVVNESGNDMYIAKDGTKVGGVDITAANLANLDVVELKVVCSGTSIKGYLNGAYEVSVTSSDYQTDTYVGIGIYRNTTNTFYADTFKLEL